MAHNGRIPEDTSKSLGPQLIVTCIIYGCLKFELQGYNLVDMSFKANRKLLLTFLMVKH